MSNLGDQKYSVLYPAYFDGPTGQKILQIGGPDALLTGVYLLANRFANPIGLYTLPLEAVRIGLDSDRLGAAMTALIKADYALYDKAGALVWIKEMARFRLGLKNKRDKLSVNDTRVIMAQRLYRQIPECPIREAFWRRYAVPLRLQGVSRPAWLRRTVQLGFSGPRASETSRVLHGNNRVSPGN